MYGNHQLAATLICCSFMLGAAVVPDMVFTDHMVLQRDKTVPVWGTANAGEEAVVTFAGQEVRATAGENGRWMVRLAPMTASSEPREMTVRGSNGGEWTIRDVLVGEVWLCSGQSNMAVSLRDIPETDSLADELANPQLRIIGTWAEWSSVPRMARPSGWSVVTPKLACGESAVALFFASRLQHELDIPVGIITSAWGGARIEPWIPPCGYDSVQELSDIAKEVNTRLAIYQKRLEDAKTYMNWRQISHDAEINGGWAGFPPEFPQEMPLWENRDCPTVLYNTMIYKYVPMAIRGVIWYQGESNLGDGPLYRQKMQALYNGWKHVFENPELPFYFVQLAPFEYVGADPGNLAVTWEAQEAFCKANEPQVGMVVINDVGDVANVHPVQKRPVGERLANLALARTYGRSDLQPDFPRPAGCVFNGTQCRISFQHVASWKTRDNAPIAYFEAAGDDGVFHSATAEVQGTDIVVSASEVPEITSVRYMWNHTAEASLFNEHNLPLGAFRFQR